MERQDGFGFLAGFSLRLDNVRDELLVLEVLYQFKREEMVATASFKNTDNMRKGCGFLSEAQANTMSLPTAMRQNGAVFIIFQRARGLRQRRYVMCYF